MNKTNDSFSKSYMIKRISNSKPPCFENIKHVTSEAIHNLAKPSVVLLFVLSSSFNTVQDDPHIIVYVNLFNTKHVISSISKPVAD